MPSIGQLKDAPALGRSVVYVAGAFAVLLLLWLVPRQLWKDPPAPAEVVIDDVTNLATPLVSWVQTSFAIKETPQTVRHELRLEDEVVVTVVAVPSDGSDKRPGSVAEWLARVEPTKDPKAVKVTLNGLVPFINGIALKGTYPISIETPIPQAKPTDSSPKVETTRFHYRLKRTDTSRDAWTVLLGRPGSGGAHRPVTFTLGTESGSTIATAFDTVRPDPSDPTALQLMAVSSWWWAIVVGMVLVLVWFLYKAQTSNILRDSDCDPDEGQMRPYSLSRLQMAVWLFIVVGVYLLIWLTTRERSDLPASVLVLIGLSSATTVGSLIIDANKRAKRRDLELKVARLSVRREVLRAERAAGPAAEKDTELAKELETLEPELAASEKELKDLPRPIQNSQGFIDDILSDGSGVSLHRLQIVVWTGTLALVFLVSAWRDLSMPVFSEGLLALMGISSGTYLGIKGTEKS